MLLDKSNYSVFIDKILDLFSNVFDKDMLFIEKQEAIEHMGYFKIRYRYLPLKYDIVIESERNVFCIDIYDEEGAKNSLYRIEEFNNETKLENIECAIRKLKNILKKNDFCFYVIREGKLYRKEGQQYKRIKDFAELMRR